MASPIRQHLLVLARKYEGGVKPFLVVDSVQELADGGARLYQVAVSPRLRFVAVYKNKVYFATCPDLNRGSFARITRVASCSRSATSSRPEPRTR
jgi:hypothetical protein